MEEGCRNEVIITTAHGDQIRVLPDFTQTVNKQQAAFSKVRNLHLNVMELIYPAILRITTQDGQEMSFKDLVEAKDLILRNLTDK